MQEEPPVYLVDLSQSIDELSDLNPQPRQATIQLSTLRQAYVVLERIDAELPLPQLPVLPTVPPPVQPLEVDLDQLERDLAALDQLLPQPQPPQAEIDWPLIAIALVNLASMQQPNHN